MEAAAIMAIVLQDYTDFALILALLVLNAWISYREESSAVGNPMLSSPPLQINEPRLMNFTTV